MKDNNVLAPRYPAAINGTVGGADRKAPIVSAFKPMSPLLTRCFIGKTRGLDDMRPESFKKATMDPVNVIPPTRTPRYALTSYGTQE